MKLCLFPTCFREPMFTFSALLAALKKKYFEEFSAVIGPKKATRFFQFENQLNAAITSAWLRRGLSSSSARLRSQDWQF